MSLKPSNHSLLAIGLVGIFIFAFKEAHTEIIKDFTNKRFLFIASGIAVFSYWIINDTPDTKKGKAFKEATRKALAALFIAYLAHLDMIFAPFFLVLVFDYYISGWF